MSAPPQPHSAECFGEQRDFWWHRDFLDLMAARWRLREASSLADIGCGLCHWSRLLYPYLRAPARFAGVDREARWVAEASEHFRRAFPKVVPDSITFHQGDAGRLPLPDNAFDVAACQGNHCVGDLLPGYFAQLGLNDIAVHQSDRPAPLFPPYATHAQKSLVEQERQWKDCANGPWDKEALRRHVLLGGGTEAFFESIFADLLENFRREQQSIAAGAFHAA